MDKVIGGMKSYRRQRTWMWLFTLILGIGLLAAFAMPVQASSSAGVNEHRVVQTAMNLQHSDHNTIMAASSDETSVLSAQSSQDIVSNEGSVNGFAGFLTNPIVSTVLLFIGIAGIAIEILVPGFGIPGIVGIAAFALYFYGGHAAGFSGYETWILFGIGLILLIFEVFVSSFGILGVLGSISLIAGVVRAAQDTSNALVSLGIAFAAAAVVITTVAILFKDRGLWNKFILKEQLSSDQSFMSNLQREQLIGLEGTSLTPLRPSGTVLLEGRHIDVVTQGGYIENNRPVKVIRVDGSRIIVDELPEKSRAEVSTDLPSVN